MVHNGGVLILYPDTNALHADLFCLRPNSRKLMDELLDGQVEVALSPVVVREAQRQARESGEETTSALRGSVRDIARKHGVDTGDTDPAIEALAARVQDVSTRALVPLLENSACRILPWPTVDAEELVRRELERRPPTRIKAGQSIGLRDTIIWHGLVELMGDLAEGDEVLFICADGGFLEEGKLASSLIEELEGEAIDVGRLRVVARLENAVVAAQERRELLTRQEGLIRQAVIDHMASFDGRTWAAVDYAGEAPLRYGIEEGLVVAVDGINIESALGTPPTTVEATAEVTISGYMRTDEYFQEFADAVEWTQGEIGDPMIGIDFTSILHFEAELELSADGEEAWVIGETLRWLE